MNKFYRNHHHFKDTDEALKIAVIGSGISGIASAWFLGQKHNVTLFEKNDYLGGHTHTVTGQDDRGSRLPIDTGFIVYNEPNYPHLSAMFDHLDIETINTEMSFSVSIDQGKLEYSGNNLNTLFAQRKNLFSLSHWGMISEILRFNRLGKQHLKHPPKNVSPNSTLKHFLETHQFSQKMVDHYLLPMAAAIWSCPTDTMKQFPVCSFLQFFENHGLLNAHNRPQWKTVKNGSHQYLKAILKAGRFDHKTHCKIAKVIPVPEKKQARIISEKGLSDTFDQVVLATHGNESYQLIDPQFRQDFNLLRAFQYQKNIAYLHTDKRLMPQNKTTWAAWNYLRDMQSNASDRVAVTYWMNRLQSLASNTQFFVTLNPLTPPDESKIQGIYQYDHPVFDGQAIKSQEKLDALQGLYGLWFAGAYTGYGFHEDGLRSAVNIAEHFNIDLPWQHPAPYKKELNHG